MNSKSQSLKDRLKKDPIGFSKDFLLKLVESELNLDKETLTKLKNLDIDVNDIKETFKKLATSRLVMRKVCRGVSRSGIRHAKGWSRHAWELMSAGHNLHALSLKFGVAEGDGPDIPSHVPLSGHAPEEVGAETVDTTPGSEVGETVDVPASGEGPTIDFPGPRSNPFDEIEKGFSIPPFEPPVMPETPEIPIDDDTFDVGGILDTVSSAIE